MLIAECVSVVFLRLEQLEDLVFLSHFEILEMQEKNS